jgi:hypothetical protein
MTTAAIYLAHLNPMTRSHEFIISTLNEKYDSVYIFPVCFIKHGLEINTKSFPFTFKVRKEMVESVFRQRVKVLPTYTFYAPYVTYLPPILSPRSWQLRKRILSKITEDKFVSYTGDKAERLMLRVYMLNPIKADRLEISASVVKKNLYQQARDGRGENIWADKVPEPVVDIVRNNWDVVSKFSRKNDETIKVLGMKFPKEGYYST